MKIFKKNVKYFKFFEDIKIIEDDSDNNRLGIVFYGKENNIYIFDSNPYINYFPITENKEDKIFENSNTKNEKTIENNNSLKISEISKINLENNLNEIFLKIQLNFNDYSLNKQKPKIIDEQGQRCIIFNNEFNNKYINKNKKKKEEIFFQISRFSITYIAEEKREKKILLSFKKPKIKNKLLSVITINSNSILGMKWFNFKGNNKENPNSKLLLSITEEGLITIYKLSNINMNNKTTIDTFDITSFQGQPFQNFIENWTLIGNNIITIPIIDYYLLSTSYIEEKREFIKLYTLHINNGIYFWAITYENNKINFSPSFSLVFEENFKIEHILIDKKELYLICFNKNGIEIYQMSQIPPFNILYKFYYEDFKNENCTSVCLDSELDTSLINNDGKLFIDDTKDLFDLGKPKFICLEKKILFQVYNSINSYYELLCFNLEGLFQVFNNLNFFKSCALGNDKTLIKKIYENKINFSFCISPSLYYNISTFGSNNFLKIKNIKKENLIENLFQVINIQTNTNNFFFKIPVFSEFEKINDKIALNYIEKENENYKCILLWMNNNTILLTSEKYLFTLIKFCKETQQLGIPLNENLILKFFDL
jgi:hypothetical protein